MGYIGLLCYRIRVVGLQGFRFRFRATVRVRIRIWISGLELGLKFGAYLVVLEWAIFSCRGGQYKGY